jgi:hypothetical protein
MSSTRCPESPRDSSGGIAAITLLNSLATGVLWNGLGFVTEREFHFTEVETYLLYIAAGSVYALAAFWSGKIVRALGRRLSPRGVMALLFAAQAVVAPFVYLRGTSVGLIVVALVTSVTGAILWPIVESYVGAGRTPEATRRAIGRWCLVWMASVAAMLVLMAPLTQTDGWLTPRLAIAGILPLSIASIAALAWVAPQPPPHHEAHEAAPASYRPQLACVRIILPASYVLVGALSPLMPYLLSQLDLPLSSQTPLTAAWLSVRLGVVAIMAHAAFWHGRWGALLAGALALAGGFALVVGVKSVPALVLGLALFGAGHGIIYYAALYYALRVGSAQIDAGSVHEGLIGLGYVIGPAAGLAGSLLGGGAWTVGVIWSILGLVAIPALQPWLRERACSARRA